MTVTTQKPHWCTCIYCETVKPTSTGSLWHSSTSNTQTFKCAECQTIDRNNRAEDGKAYKYNMSIEEWNMLYKSQHGLCAICRKAISKE